MGVVVPVRMPIGMGVPMSMAVVMGVGRGGNHAENVIL